MAHVTAELTLKTPHQRGDGAWVWEVEPPTTGPCPQLAYALKLGCKSGKGALINQKNRAASLRYQGYIVHLEGTKNARTR